jgi:predicted nucleic acid-binding protein
MLIYLDCCSWCRPYDDLSDSNNYFESEAVLEILKIAKAQSWVIAASQVNDIEIMRISDEEKLSKVLELYKSANEYLSINDAIRKLAASYQLQKIRLYDSLHLATAEVNSYDLLFTTDRNFCRDAGAIKTKVKVWNPRKWLSEVYNNG